jgi:hypothetical protein
MVMTTKLFQLQATSKRYH